MPMASAWTAFECFTATLHHENIELELTKDIACGSITHLVCCKAQYLVLFYSIFT